MLGQCLCRLEEEFWQDQIEWTFWNDGACETMDFGLAREAKWHLDSSDRLDHPAIRNPESFLVWNEGLAKVRDQFVGDEGVLCSGIRGGRYLDVADFSLHNVVGCVLPGTGSGIGRTQATMKGIPVEDLVKPLVRFRLAQFPGWFKFATLDQGPLHRHQIRRHPSWQSTGQTHANASPESQHLLGYFLIKKVEAAASCLKMDDGLCDLPLKACLRHAIQFFEHYFHIAPIAFF
jgi:hypothetical protein